MDRIDLKMPSSLSKMTMTIRVDVTYQQMKQAKAAFGAKVITIYSENPEADIFRLVSTIENHPMYLMWYVSVSEKPPTFAADFPNAQQVTDIT